MPSHALLLVLGAAGLAVSAAASLALAAAAAVPAQPAGHLVLQIEGDATVLHVTRITPRPDACGPARFASDHAIVVRDAAGAELGRVPLDLSAFDLDPARAGAALRVEGCVVRDPRVAMLANVPHWPTAAALEIVHAQRVLGRLDATAYAALLAAGARR